jgi:small neutral amino acid transporter SnatA (MarC family)
VTQTKANKVGLHVIRILLLILLIGGLGGAGFLYFWDIPIEQERIEKPLDERVLRD